MNIFFIDVDNTIAPFRPTAELYKRLFLSKTNIKYRLLGYFMVILLKLFWFFPFIIEFQRKLIMSMFADANADQLTYESNMIADEVATSYKINFKSIIDAYRQPEDRIYLLTHCPDTITKRIVLLLKFNGEYSLKIDNYFEKGSKLQNLNKEMAIMECKSNNPNANVYYFADDLIDIKCLLQANHGILINASFFTKLVCRLFFNKIRIIN